MDIGIKQKSFLYGASLVAMLSSAYVLDGQSVHASEKKNLDIVCSESFQTPRFQKLLVSKAASSKTYTRKLSDGVERYRERLNKRNSYASLSEIRANWSLRIVKQGKDKAIAYNRENKVIDKFHVKTQGPALKTTRTYNTGSSHSLIKKKAYEGPIRKGNRGTFQAWKVRPQNFISTQFMSKVLKFEVSHEEGPYLLLSRAAQNKEGTKFKTNVYACAMTND